MEPLILITNDDGLASPGLLAAAQAVSGLGRLLIAAPKYQQTAMSRSLPRNEDTGIIEKVEIKVNEKTLDAYMVNGSPAQAVAYAVLELADKKPDLCISGINYGENLGLMLSCSGTVGAAFEADTYNIPAIAVSLGTDYNNFFSNEYAAMDWTAAQKITFNLASRVLKNRFPNGVNVLNVNVPIEADLNTEVRTTVLGRLNCYEYIKPETRDFTKGYKLKAKLNLDKDKIDKTSDVYAFYFDKVISVTPLTWDLTAKYNWKL